MRPPKLHITILSAILLMRANARLLLARIGLEILGASFFALARSAAAGWIDRAPLALASWTGAAAMMLSGAAVYFATRVIARVGAIACVFAAARKKPSEGLVLEGCAGFVEGTVGTLALLALDVLGLLCLLCAIALTGKLGHGALSAAVAAGFVTLVALAWLSAATFGGFAFVLGALDGDGIFAAWPRVRRLLGSADGPTRERFSSLWFVLGALAIAIGVVDFVSTLVSSFGGQTVTEGQSLLVIVPIFTLVYSMLVDVAALVFFAALTDRLPLGFATPIVLATPREQGST
jgi:hypothetical protein